jgi:hypothetical protein
VDRVVCPLFTTTLCYNGLRGKMATKPAFAQGAQVEHGKFGLGSVLSCNEEYIVIKWDDHGEKKFVLSIVLPNLKKSDRTPPVEKRRSTRKKVAPAAAV